MESHSQTPPTGHRKEQADLQDFFFFLAELTNEKHLENDVEIQWESTHSPVSQGYLDISRQRTSHHRLPSAPATLTEWGTLAVSCPYAPFG